MIEYILNIIIRSKVEVEVFV